MFWSYFHFFNLFFKEKKLLNLLSANQSDPCVPTLGPAHWPGHQLPRPLHIPSPLPLLKPYRFFFQDVLPLALLPPFVSLRFCWTLTPPAWPVGQVRLCSAET